MGWFERRNRPEPEPEGPDSDEPGPGDPGGPAPGDLGAGPEDVAPLTDERVVAWLTAHRYAWFRDNDGDLGGLWRGRTFFFFRFGPAREILQVRGHWNRDAAIERLPELLEVCNEHNVERIWPKAYTRVADDGRVTVVGEVSTNLERGVTDAQLAELLDCGLTTGARLFDELDARFPDPLRRPA